MPFASWIFRLTLSIVSLGSTPRVMIVPAPTILSRVVVLTRIRMLFTLPSIGLLPPLRPPAWAIASCSAVPAGESDLLFMPLTGLGPDVLMDFPLLITDHVSPAGRRWPWLTPQNTALFKP